MKIAIDKISLNIGGQMFRPSNINEANILLSEHSNHTGYVTFCVIFQDGFKYEGGAESILNLHQFILDEWEFNAGNKNTRNIENWSEHVTRGFQTGVSQRYSKYLKKYYFGPQFIFLIYIGKESLTDQRGRYCLLVEAKDYFACEADHSKTLEGTIVATYSNKAGTSLNSHSKYFENPFASMAIHGNPVYVRTTRANEMIWRYTRSDFEKMVEHNKF